MAFYEFLSTKDGGRFPNIIKILIFARFWLGNKIIMRMIRRFLFWKPIRQEDEASKT